MTSNNKSNHNPFEHLLSKLIAGGLSAGLVLAWWPALFPNAGVLSWCWRGLIWTLLFELLLGALAPLEFALKSHHIIRNGKQVIAARLDNLTRFAPRSATSSAILVAFAALALPAGLILTGSSRANKTTANNPPAVRVVKTVKPVKVIRITKVVRETNGVQVLESTSKKSEGSLTKTPKKKSSKKISKKSSNTSAPTNNDQSNNQSGGNQSGGNQSGGNQSGGNQSDPAPVPESPPTNAQSAM